MESLLTRLDSIATYPLFSLGGSQITLVSLLVFVLVIAAFFLISRYLRSLVDRRWGERMKRGMGHTVKRLIHYSTVVLGIFVAFNVIGLNLSSLAIVAGGVGVGIGFGLQNLASNFISGLILMVERPIRVGDAVTVNEEFGFVEEIALRSSRVVTTDNVELIIPNADFITGTVVNWSRGDERIRERCSIGVAYGADIERVMDLLKAIAAENEDVLEDPAPQIILDEYGDSSINFELRVWVESPRKRVNVRHEINVAIRGRFEEEDIEIPYPQRDLHLRSSVPVSRE